MNRKNTMILLCIFYTFSYFMLVFTNAYMLTYLDSIGYNAMQRGILLSGIAIVAILSPILIGFLCDRFKTVKKIYNLTLIGLLLVNLFLYQLTSQQFFIHLIFTALTGGLFHTLSTIQDTWTLEIDSFYKTRFGPIRAFGAIGWMIASPIAGWVVEKYGYSMLGYVFAGLAILNILFTLSLPDANKEVNAKPIRFTELCELLKNPNYRLVVFIFLFINIMSSADGFTAIDKMISLGAKESLIGFRWSLQAFVELPLFFAGTYLLRKFGGLKLTMFGTTMYILRFISYAFATTAEMIVIVSLMQLVTFPLTTLTSRTMVDHVTPTRLKSSGLAIASSIYVGIPALITPILAGMLISGFGIDIALVIIASLGSIALLLGIFYHKKSTANV